MVSFDEKLDEIYSGVKSLSQRELFLYLDLLVQRRLLRKSGRWYEATDTFKQLIYRHTSMAVKRAVEKFQRTGHKSSLHDILVFISLSIALELMTGKAPPVHEDDLEFVNRKEVGKLARTIYTFFVARREHELERLAEELEYLYEEKGI